MTNVGLLSDRGGKLALPESQQRWHLFTQIPAQDRPAARQGVDLMRQAWVNSRLQEWLIPFRCGSFWPASPKGRFPWVPLERVTVFSSL